MPTLSEKGVKGEYSLEVHSDHMLEVLQVFEVFLSQPVVFHNHTLRRIQHFSTLSILFEYDDARIRHILHLHRT